MSRQLGAFSGLAIALIVLNHAITLGIDAQVPAGFSAIGGWEQTLLSILQALGMFAVPIFLFISGNFVAYAAQGNPPRLSSKFLWSTLRHILIPYLIWSILFYILVLFVHDKRYSLVDYVKNLLVGYPYHFIPLLLFYYLVSPFLVILGKRYALPMLILVGIYQIFSMNVLHPGMLAFSFPAWTRWLTLPVLRQTLADWAIYFPLGLSFGLHANVLLPWLKRWNWLLLLSTVIVFFVGVLDAYKVITFPFASFICQTTFVLALPAISRQSIPIFRQFEDLGKRSYGLYLTHLIIIDLSLLVLGLILKGIIGLHIVLFPLLFVMGLFIPLGIMNLASRGRVKRAYRYVFG
jgi:peptidoglycan/LPS O-acetylase OafA/YrhL